MQIVIDEFNLEAHLDSFVVTDDSTFIEARKKIFNFKRNGPNGILILVTKHPYTTWFYDLENEPFITFRKVLPSINLKEKFSNVELDGELDEKDIVYLDLLHQTIEPTEISIINKFIGPFLLGGLNLLERLYQMTTFAANPPKQFSDSTYLRRKWSKYIDRIESDKPIIRSLVLPLKDIDSEFCKLINQLIYVSNSQNLLKEWIHENRVYIETTLQYAAKEFEKFLTEYHYSAPLNEQYEAKIERYFKSLYKEDINEFFKEKGDYKASLKSFLYFAKSLTIAEKEIIYSNYRRNIDYELGEQIKALIKPELYIPPRVEELSLSSQIDEWHKWAINYFIPFKFYLDNFPNEDDILLVEEYANNYSDWFINSYSNIIQNGIKTNYNIPGLINTELADASVIWLIIDGFPSIFIDALISVLKTNGINNIKLNYHFAVIPTITKMGIPTQLSGKFQKEDGNSIERIDLLKKSFCNKNVVYKNSINSFAQVLETEFDVCCLHWREIDEFMHKDDSDVDSSRIEEIIRLLSIRILQITNTIKVNSDKKFKLVISTDHGCTKCLKKDLNIKNSNLFEACKDNPKERCVELSGPLSKVHIDENETYYLKSEQTLNSNDWIVAKGYRYFGKFDYGYRHGGLTPEETIVPFLICGMTQNEIVPIKLKYGGYSELKVGFMEMLILHVTNDNDAVLEINEIRIEEDKNFTIDISQKIQPFSSNTFEGKIKLSKSTVVKEGQTQICIIIDYSIFGAKYQDECIISLPIKKPLNEGLDILIS